MLDDVSTRIGYQINHGMRNILQLILKHEKKIYHKKKYLYFRKYIFNVFDVWIWNSME